MTKNEKNPAIDGGMCFAHPRCTTLTAEAMAAVLEYMEPYLKSKKAMLTLAIDVRDLIIADPGIVQELLAGGVPLSADRDGHLRRLPETGKK